MCVSGGGGGGGERGDRYSEWVGRVERQQTVTENGKGQKRRERERERERERVQERGWGRDKK